MNVFERILNIPLDKKCAYSEFFWFLYSVYFGSLRIQSEAGKYGPGKLRIRTLLMQFAFVYFIVPLIIRLHSFFPNAPFLHLLFFLRYFSENSQLKCNKGKSIVIFHRGKLVATFHFLNTTKKREGAPKGAYVSHYKGARLKIHSDRYGIFRVSS